MARIMLSVGGALAAGLLIEWLFVKYSVAEQATRDGQFYLIVRQENEK